jgi:hypothetical protein
MTSEETDAFYARDGIQRLMRGLLIVNGKYR